MVSLGFTCGVLWQLGQQMDEHLAGLAHAHLGMRFVRSPLPRGCALPRLLGVQHPPGGSLHGKL